MKQRIRVSAIILALFVSTLTITHAQAPAAKPDFTGTWKINLAQSQFSPGPQPITQTEIITLTGDDLTIDYSSTAEDGKQKFLYTLKLGGPEVPMPKPIVNETPLIPISLKAEWRGASIVVTEKITYQGGAGFITSTYALSPDGKTLTKSMLASVDQGDFDLKAVYDKA